MVPRLGEVHLTESVLDEFRYRGLAKLTEPVLDELKITLFPAGVFL